MDDDRNSRKLAEIWLDIDPSLAGGQRFRVVNLSSGVEGVGWRPEDALEDMRSKTLNQE